MEYVPGSFQGRIRDQDRSREGSVTWNMYQDRSGDKTRDVGQVPGPFQGRICHVKQVPGAVAGARDVAVAGQVTLQGPETLRWQRTKQLQGTATPEDLRSPRPETLL